MLDRAQKIRDVVRDLVSGLMYCDRKEDEELPRCAIEEAVAKGEITYDEIVKALGLTAYDSAVALIYCMERWPEGAVTDGWCILENISTIKKLEDQLLPQDRQVRLYKEHSSYNPPHLEWWTLRLMKGNGSNPVYAGAASEGRVRLAAMFKFLAGGE